MTINPVRTNKQRALRVSLVSHYRWDRMQAWRYGLVVAVTIGFLAWGWKIMFFSSGKTLVMPDHVSQQHAFFENDCAQCHDQTENLWNRFASLLNSKQTITNSVYTRKAMDQKCINCHQVTCHHPRLRDQDVRGCIACHTEHLGVNANLTRIKNAGCVECHQNLDAKPTETVSSEGVDTIQQQISRFDIGVDSTSHPTEARSLGQIPKPNLKFSHAAHLTKGLPKTTEDTGTMKWSDLPETAQKRLLLRTIQEDGNSNLIGLEETDDLQKLYELAEIPSPDEKIQLSCTACHQLGIRDFSKDDFPSLQHEKWGLARVATDSGIELPGGFLRPRESGRYMLPIAYEKDCQVCHPLSLDVRIPHRLDAQKLSEIVYGWARRVHAQAESPADKDRAEDGSLDPLNRVRMEINQPPQKNTNSDVTLALKAERHVRLQCAKCHVVPEPKTDDAAIATNRLPATPLIEDFVPLPTVFLKHAKFSHSAHQFLQCSECHPQAKKSHLAQHVLVNKDLKSCAKCHGESASPPIARSDCVECHWYHGADQQWSSSGSRPIEGRKRKTTSEYLDLFHQGKK